MNKKEIIIIIVITILLVLLTMLFKIYNESVDNNFCCKSIKGRIVKIDEDIKKYKEIELNNKEKHYLGFYLGKDLASEIQIGDSIFKDKNSMKIILYRNNEILGYDSNTYSSKNLKCECN